MRMSQKNRSKVYGAIADPITEKRMMISRHGVPRSEQVDRMLFDLEIDIWKRVAKALKLEETA